MIDNKRFTGKDRLPLLKALKNDRTILQMSLPGSTFTKLTVITGIARKGQKLFLTVKCPQGFQEAVCSLPEWRLSFSFSGDQGIPYVFKTGGGELLDNDTLLLEIPEEIRQNQRRQHTRIKLDPGARLTARSAEEQYSLAINDISEGGVLVINEDQRTPPRQLLRKEQVLTDLLIELTPEKPDSEPIFVNRATVRRVAIAPSTGNYHYGLMFTDIEDREVQRLKQAIDTNNPKKLRKKIKAE